MNDSPSTPAAPRRRPLRRVLKALGLLLATVVALLLLAQLLVDTTALRETAAAQASRALGHPVRLAGAARLTLLPWPSLAVDDVHVDSMTWKGESRLLTARRVVLEPSLTALLRGDLVLDGLALQGAEVWVLRDEAGRFNWQGATAGPGPGALAAIAGEDVTLHYGDAERRGTLARARIHGAVGGDGRVRADVSGRLQDAATLMPTALLDVLGAGDDGLPVEARLDAGPGQTLAFTEVTLGAGRSAATGHLRLDRAQAPPRFEAGLRLDALALPACAREGAPREDPPAALSSPGAAFAGWAGEVDVAVGSLRIGERAFADLRVTATVGADEVAARAESGKDSVILALGRAGDAGTGVRLQAQAGRDAASVVLGCLHLPQQVAARVENARLDLRGAGRDWQAVAEAASGSLQVTWTTPDAVDGWGIAALDAQLAEGRLAKADVTLAGDGGRTLAVTFSGGPLHELVDGEWPFEARSVVDGRPVEVAGVLSRAGGALTASGTLHSAPAAGEAGGAEVQSRLRWQLAGSVVELDDLKYSVAGNTLTGRLAFDLATQPVVVRGDLSLGSTSIDWFSALAPQGAAGAPGLPPFRIDDLRVRVGALQGLPFPLAGVDARINTRGDELRLEPLAVEMLASRWTGSIALNVAATPPAARYSLAADEVVPGSASTAAVGPVHLRAAHQVRLSGRWTGSDLAAVTSSLEVDISGQHLELGGLPGPLRDLALEGVTARYRPQGGFAASGLARLGAEALELEITAAPHDGQPGWRVKASARGGLGELRAAGDLAGGPGNVVEVSARGEDAGRLLGLLSAPHAGVSGGWRGSARVAHGGDSWVFSALVAGVDGVGEITGEGRLAGGERPLLTARLASERLDLAGFASAGVMPATAPAQPTGRSIPNSPLPDPPELGFDVDVSLRAAQVLGLPRPLADVRARLRGEGGTLVAEDLHAVLESGATITGRVETQAGEPARRWNVAIEGRGVDMGTFLDQQDQGTAIGWPADSTLTLEGTGADVHALLASARGRLEVNGQGTTLGTEDFSVWNTNLVMMMLPGMGTLQPARMNCASIDAQIGDGKLTTEALVIDAENVTIAGTGSLDLRSEAVDLMLVPRPKQQRLLRGATPVRVTGTLGDPKVSVATGAFVASHSIMLLGAMNPYLLLGAMMPATTTGNDAAVCDRAAEVAADAPEEVEAKAAELEKGHAGGVARVLTAPFRAIGRALGGSSASEPAPPAEPER